MAIRKPKVSAKEARRLAGQLPSDKPAVEKTTAPTEQAAPAPSPAKTPAPKAAAPVQDDQAVAAAKAIPAQSESAPTASSAPQRAIEAPAPAPALSTPAAQASAATPISLGNRKTQVFLSAVIPAAGVSKSYDELSRFYPPAKALQMILRRAMSDYEILLANGKFPTSTLAYPVPDGRPGQLLVQTSRSMPNELVVIALAHFDPLGFESKRAFGLKLATAALANFFKKER